jgi:bifunctional ADP-heptose synthase (sugar kinase/adenylyltransferase)
MRERCVFDDFLSIINSINKLKILFVGETIVDEYHYVSTLGKASKENLVPTLFKDEERFAGGVIAAANHLASFCKEIHVLTSMSSDRDTISLVKETINKNINITIVPGPKNSTIIKRRFVDADYLRKLFEVYFMDESPMNGNQEDEIVDNIRKLAPKYDVVIVTDFGHGLITKRMRDELINNSKFLAVNAQSNSANHGFNLITKYSRADYICIDAPEARLAVGDQHIELGVIAENLLPSKINCSRIILTHGRHGCVTYDEATGIKRIPAFNTRAIDTIGAGDAFLSVTAPMVAQGHNIEKIGFIGNAVGAMKVGIVGHRESVDKISLVKYINTLLK